MTFGWENFATKMSEMTLYSFYICVSFSYYYKGMLFEFKISKWYYNLFVKQ